MMATTELVVETCWCGVAHAVPTALVDEQKRQHRNGEKPMGIYCPLGHVWVPAGQPEIDKVRQRNAELEAQLVATRDQLDTATADLTRTKARVGRGVCPCCKRSFAQLTRHMRGQHPDYTS